MTDNNANAKNTAAVLELLASRICHDIISPVGAINNGIELMQEMGPEAMDDGLDLVAYSASQSAAKLAAFRLAYGAGGRDPHVKPEDVQKTFGELIRAEGKISQTWDPYGNLGPNSDNRALPPGYCKMLMCAMMLAMECLPKGGYISVRPSGDHQSTIIAEGEGVVLREQVQEALEQKLNPEDLDPRLVHPYAISVLADAYDFKITLGSVDDDRIKFIMDCPKVEEQAANDEEDETVGSAHEQVG